MPFVTEQTKCLSFLLKHHQGKCPGKDTKGGWGFTHHQSTASGFVFVFCFHCRETFFITFSSSWGLFLLLPILLRYSLHWSIAFTLSSDVLLYWVIFSSDLLHIYGLPLSWSQTACLIRYGEKDGRIMWERSEISQHTYCRCRWFTVFRDGRQVSYQNKRQNI